MLQDIRFGLRQAIRKPGLIVAAVVCLAFGTGANLMVFGLINAVVLRPVPGVAAPEQLAVIMNRTGDDGYDLTSYPDYLDHRNNNHSFSDLLAYRAMHVSLSGDEFSERIQGAIGLFIFCTCLLPYSAILYLSPKVVMDRPVSHVSQAVSKERIYTHVLNKGGRVVRSPADSL